MTRRDDGGQEERPARRAHAQCPARGLRGAYRRDDPRQDHRGGPHRPGRHQPQDFLLALRDHRGLLRRNHERHHGRVLRVLRENAGRPLGYGRSRPALLPLPSRSASHDRAAGVLAELLRFRRAHLCHPDEPLPSLCRRAVLARGDHARERRTDIYARLFATWPWNATANGCARERSFPWKRRPRFSAP